MRWLLLVVPSLLVALAGLIVLWVPGGVSAVQPAIPALKAAVACACGALLLADRLLARRDLAGGVRRAARDGLLVALALASLLLWTHFTTAYRLERLHRWDFYHHFVGAKYFDELGYTRLYDCVAVADEIAGVSPPLSQRPVRRLATNQIELGSTVLAASLDCPKLFTPARWRAFQQDLAFFRVNMTEQDWWTAQTDHGLNASPAWLLVGSWLANRGPASIEHVRLIFWLDPLLLVLLFASAGWAFGWRPLCLALVFFGTSLPSDIAWAGRSFLRFDWLAASVIGLSLLKRGRYAASGVLLTLGALSRVIPAFLIASLLLSVTLRLVQSRRAQIPARWWRFAAGAAATLCVVVPLSAASTGGFGSWADFAENSGRHLEVQLLSFVGWPVVVSYEHESRVELARDPSAMNPFHRWNARRAELSEQRAPLRWLGVLVFAAMLARAALRQEDWVMGVLGAGAVVMATSIGAYYYALLLVYAFLWPRSVGIGVGLCGVALASRLASVSFDRLDEVHFWTSLAAVLFVMAATAEMAWRGERPAAETVSDGADPGAA